MNSNATQTEGEGKMSTIEDKLADGVPHEDAIEELLADYAEFYKEVHGVSPRLEYAVARAWTYAQWQEAFRELQRAQF